MFQELHNQYLSILQDKDFHQELVLTPEEVEKLTTLTERINQSSIPAAIETLFVHPYAGFSDISLRWKFFLDEPVDAYRVVRLVEEEKILWFDHIAFLAFLHECEHAEEIMNSRFGRADFRTYRLNAFLRELKKLPIKYLAFICVLREIAKEAELSKCERLRRDKDPQATDVSYISLLWAFKELETRVALTSHNNLRADYKLFWYESEWVDGE